MVIAFRKAIGTEAFWPVAVIALAVWEVVYNVLVSRGLGLGQHGIQAGVATSLLGFALVVVAYVGLFSYAYRRHDFWLMARAILPTVERRPREDDLSDTCRPGQYQSCSPAGRPAP